MNFISVGIVLCALNFNLSWELHYAVKLVGVLFMLAGLREADTVTEGFSRFRREVLAVGAAAAAGLAGLLLCRLTHPPAVAVSALSIVLGLLTGFGTLVSQKRILGELEAQREVMVNDPSLIHAVRRTWNKYAPVTAMTLTADVLYRLLPDSEVQAVIGAVEVVTRIVMYVLVIVLASSLARACRDFNIMHPTDT